MARGIERLKHDVPLWLLSSGLAYLLCVPLLGGLGALVGTLLPLAVFHPAVEIVECWLRTRSLDLSRPEWSWRGLARPQNLCSLAALTTIVIVLWPMYGMPAQPHPTAARFALLVCVALFLPLGGLRMRRSGPDGARLPSPFLTGWTLIGAGLFGVSGWMVQRVTLPLAYGSVAPTPPTAPFWAPVRWLDGQIQSSLFAPSFTQWYWPLLLAGAGLLTGGVSAGLRAWALHSPAAAPSPQAPFDQVFLSYSRQDIDRARTYVQALEDSGQTVWADWQDIEPSQEWRRELEEAIRDSGALIVLLSQASLRSRYCLEEWRQAFDEGKRILPVLIDPELEAQGVTAALREAGWDELTALQRLPLCTPEEWEPGVRATLAFVDREHTWVALHTRLGKQAHDWHERGRPASRLLRRHETAEAEAWRTNTPRTPRFDAHPTDRQLTFIDASRAALRRRTRRLVLTAVASATALVALSSLVVASQTDARSQRQAMLSRALAEASAAHPDPGVDESSLLAAAAYGQADTAEAQHAMLTQLLRFNHTTRLLMGANQNMLSSAFSADGSVFALGTGQGSTQLWDPVHWRLKGTVPGDMPDVATHALSRNGDLLAVRREGHVATVDTSRLRTVGQLRPTEAPLAGKWFGGITPDGSRLVVGVDPVPEWTGPAHAWTAPARRTSGGTHFSCLEPDLSPRGTYVWCSGGTGDASTLRTLQTGRKVRFSGRPNLAGWSAKEHPIADSRGTARVLDPRGPAHTWTPQRGMAFAAVTTDGHRLALHRADYGSPGRYDVWDPDTHRRIARSTKDGPADDPETRDRELPGIVENVPGHSGWTKPHGSLPLAVTYSRDRRAAISPTSDGSVLAWRLDGRGRIVTRTPVPALDSESGALSPDGRTLAVVQKRQVRLLRVRDGRQLRAVRLAGTGNTVAWRRDGRALAVSETVGTGEQTGMGERQRTRIELFTGNAGHRTGTLKSPAPADPREFHPAMSFSPDGRRLFLAESQAGAVREWDIGKRSLARTYGGGSAANYLDAMDLSPDGRTVATADRNRFVRLWDTRTGRQVWQRPDAGDMVAYSPDGGKLVTGNGEGGGVQVWNAHTRHREGPRLNVSPSAGESLLSLGFTPEGHRLLVASSDPVKERSVGRIRLWDWKQQTRVGPVLATVGTDTQMHMTPGAGRAVVAGRGEIVTLEMDPRRWQYSLCTLADRWLSRSEWRAAAPNQRYPTACTPPASTTG
ncbi:toll/interleukin-1 receptor domain-containing protein [Streptomyces sp. ODS28]|uniref:toll/interleukin-1 receptor domain-containing protein n=1 Tax=Streptomyces sp. ODS28 TaxID=3136688 RepID=UPI0031E936DD